MRNNSILEHDEHGEELRINMFFCVHSEIKIANFNPEFKKMKILIVHIFNTRK